MCTLSHRSLVTVYNCHTMGGIISWWWLGSDDEEKEEEEGEGEEEKWEGLESPADQGNLSASSYCDPDYLDFETAATHSSYNYLDPNYLPGK